MKLCKIARCCIFSPGTRVLLVHHFIPCCKIVSCNIMHYIPFFFFFFVWLWCKTIKVHKLISYALRKIEEFIRKIWLHLFTFCSVISITNSIYFSFAETSKRVYPNLIESIIHSYTTTQVINLTYIEAFFQWPFTLVIGLLYPVTEGGQTMFQTHKIKLESSKYEPIHVRFDYHFKTVTS